MSHIKNPEENIAKMCGAETTSTLGDSGGFTRKKCRDWHGYQKHGGTFHRMALKGPATILGAHGNLFSLVQALKLGFQVKSEGASLNLEETRPKSGLIRKWKTLEATAFSRWQGFSRIQGNPLSWALRHVIQKGSQPPRQKGRRRQKNKNYNQTDINNIHVNIVYTGKERIKVAERHLNYSIRGDIYAWKYWTTVKSKQEVLHKVLEDLDFKPGKIFYLDITS